MPNRVYAWILILGCDCEDTAHLLLSTNQAVCSEIRLLGETLSNSNGLYMIFCGPDFYLGSHPFGQLGPTRGGVNCLLYRSNLVMSSLAKLVWCLDSA